jgi:hypothetical protein
LTDDKKQKKGGMVSEETIAQQTKDLKEGKDTQVLPLEVSMVFVVDQLAQLNVNVKELAKVIDKLYIHKSNCENNVVGPVTTLVGPTSTPVVSTPQIANPNEAVELTVDARVAEVMKAFPNDLQGMLLFKTDESSMFVIIRPRRFLGSDNFAKIGTIVRNIGGEYVSQGKTSHFKIPYNIETK